MKGHRLRNTTGSTRWNICTGSWALPPVRNYTFPRRLLYKYTTKSALVKAKIRIIILLMNAHIAAIHYLLTHRGGTVAVAESCTGGLLAKLLTDTPGSSKYFVLGVVAYSNKAKNTILSIPVEIIEKYGAVSLETAKRMAEGIRTLAQSTYGIGITGIAGPSGTIPGKPVGTVCIAACSHHTLVCRQFHFKGSRQKIRELACLQALAILKKVIG